MLKLKPNCEHCGRDLPPNATSAMICSFECTFCYECVEDVLGNVCPNCGGGFERRPVRPSPELAAHPASTEREHRPVDPLKHAERRRRLEHVSPAQR